MREEVVLTFFDLKRFFLRHRLFVLKRASLITGCLFFFFLVQPLSYKHESTLRTLGGATSSTLQELLPLSTGGLNVDLTTSLLASSQMMTQVIEEMGLQVFSPLDSWITRIGKQIKNRILFEIAQPTSSSESFSFCSVVFSGEKSLRLLLKFNDKGEYELWDRKKQLIGRAKIGFPIRSSWGELTLKGVPEQSKAETFYPIKLFPLERTLKFWRKKLKAFPSKSSKSLVQMEVIHTDRYLGAALLNTWMGFCELFVQKEQDEIYKSQICSLEKQSEELVSSYHLALLNYAHYLEGNIREGGSTEYVQEVKLLSEPKQKYLSKLQDIDLELKRLGSQTEGTEKESGEFVGMSVSVVSELLTDYNRQKNTLQSQLNELLFLKDQIEEPQFEITSLGSVLEDQVTRDLVAKASEIALQLQDKGNRNVREQERLAEEIVSQKNFLSHYLCQTIELKTAKVDLLKDKISSLKRIFENLLQSEQSLLKHKLEDLKDSMQGLPQQWYQESLLALKKEQVASLLKGTEQLIASLHMEKSSSNRGVKPLDRATIPNTPQGMKLFVLALITLISSFFVLYGFLFIKTLYEGFPLSAQMLRGLGASVCGTLPLKGGNVNFLHRLVDFISSKPSQIVVSIGGEYSLDLGSILSRRGHKTVIVSASPPPPYSECDYLVLEEVDPINYFCSLSFREKLMQLKEQYDYIFLDPLSKAAQVESESLLKLADCVILTVENEKKKDLIPYFNWVDGSVERRITFVCVQDE